jgi:hypothetical protein
MLIRGDRRYNAAALSIGIVVIIRANRSQSYDLRIYNHNTRVVLG